MLDELCGCYGFDAELLAGFAHFRPSGRGHSACFNEALANIRDTRVTPYGSIAARDPEAQPEDSGLQLAPWVHAERAGLNALADLGFADAQNLGDFVCRAFLEGWDGARIAEAIAYAHEYQGFRERFQLPTPRQVERDKTPLFDRLARRKLRAVMNDRLYRAQQAVTLEATADIWLSPLVTGDERLGARARAFALTAPKLTLLLGLYEQYDLFM